MLLIACRRVWWGPGATQRPRAGTQHGAGLNPNPRSARRCFQITVTKGDFILIDFPTNRLFQKLLAAAVGHFWLTGWLRVAWFNDCILCAS